MTWLLAGLNIGVAMGAAVAGQVVDLGWSGFGVAVVAGGIVVLVGGWGFRRLGG